MMNTFETLNAINVNEHTEKKETDGGRTLLTYLSWPWAWAEVKKRYPDAQYTIIKDSAGLPYFSDPRTGIMVYTTVTIDGITHEMWLPVMDGQNKAMRFEPYEIQTKYKTITVKPATMFDVNKTIMRCLTKNLAMFGLGLYIYAGEDLPESEPKGSTEAAQDVGKKKLEEMNKQAAALKGPATEEQRKYIIDHADDETYVKAMTAFGENLETMTAAQANKLIARIKESA